MHLDNLVGLGLTRREAATYIALLGLGEAKPGEIARMSHESRTNVYDSLSSLVKKGLASYAVRGKSTFYCACDPSRLKDLLSEKEKALEASMPALVSLRNSNKGDYSVHLYEGKEGIKTVLSDALNEGKEILVFGSSGWLSELYPEYAKAYVREHAKRNIRSRQLCAEGSKILRSPLTECRTLPKEFSGPSSTMIYGNSLAIMLWFTNPPGAVLIKSNEAASAYRSYFEFTWKMVGEKQPPARIYGAKPAAQKFGGMPKKP